MNVQVEDSFAARAHVLVATEDPGLRVQIDETLRKDGHHVTGVEDGVELLERLVATHETRFHVVIADIELSGFTGLEVLGLTDGAPERPPILLMIPAGEPTLRRAAAQFGAKGVIERPYDVDELRLLVATLIRTPHRPLGSRAA